MAFIVLAGVIFLLDLGIKELIQGVEDKEFPMELKGSKGKLFLYKNYNKGLPFGFLQEYPDVVRYLPLMVMSAMAGIFFWLIPKRGFWFEKIALAFTLGGGASNLYDRFKRQYVVDYLNIRWKSLQKVIFNLGDFFIVCGAVLLFFRSVYDMLKK